MPDRRVMVTGGLGFVGAHLCRRLIADGYELAIVDDCRLGSPENLTGIQPHDVYLDRSDIRDTDAVLRALRQFRPDIVVHLAAIHFIPLCDANPRLAIDVNVSGTQSVLDACASAADIEGIVFASTGAVYLPSLDALNESSELGPTDIYGLTKLWGEQLMGLYQARTGSGVAIARLFNVYGPRETNPHFIPSVLLQARHGGTLELGDLTTRRDYIYAEDVAAGLATLAGRLSAGERTICNLGSGRAVAGTEVIECVARVVGRSLDVRRDPARLRASDRPVLLSDPAFAGRMLGWTPRTSLERGLTTAIEDPVAVGVEVT